MVVRIQALVRRSLTSSQVGAVGGGLAKTVGGVTQGLGNTVKSGGNIAREGMGSGEGQGSAAGGATDTASEEKGEMLKRLPTKAPMSLISLRRKLRMPRLKM